MINTIAKITRKFHPRGTERILRLLNNPDNPDRKIVRTVLEYYNGLKLNIDTSYPIDWFIFFKGTYEENNLKKILPFIKEGNVFLDAGANFGYYSLIFSQTAEKVYAFEPNPMVYKRLLENINLNHIRNIVTEPQCLSDVSSKSIKLYTVSGAEKGNATLSFRSDSKIVECEATTIDNYFKDKDRLDFIKIDVEGAEDKVLRGAQETLGRLRPVILFESFKPEQNLSDLLPNYQIETTGIDYFLAIPA